MPEVSGIERAIKEIVALHDDKHPHHAVATIKQVIGEMSAFIKDCPDDPILLAYALRTPMGTWTTHLLKISYWLHDMIETGDPSTPSEGAR